MYDMFTPTKPELDSGLSPSRFIYVPNGIVFIQMSDLVWHQSLIKLSETLYHQVTALYKSMKHKTLAAGFVIRPDFQEVGEKMRMYPASSSRRSPAEQDRIGFDIRRFTRVGMRLYNLGVGDKRDEFSEEDAPVVTRNARVNRVSQVIVRFYEIFLKEERICSRVKRTSFYLFLNEVRSLSNRKMDVMITLSVVVVILSMTRTSHVLAKNPEPMNSLTQCETAIKEIEREDHATVVDDSQFRLYFTWLSQECEIRAGPEYIIRKYTFFKNGTFLLLRYHYVEESCSIATHTVVIRGSIKLLGSSTVVPGATETRVHIDAINIVPLNRQVAHKFGHRLNLTCGPQPKWRPYVPEVIYEQPRQRSATSLWQGPIYNSLQAHSFTKNRFGINCLKPFGIELTELRLLRVEKKLFGSLFNNDRDHKLPQFQLFLARPTPNVQSRWNYKPTSLQSTAMIRADTTSGCPICSSVSRSSEFNPPLLHQTVALPALIGGYWHSERCESSEGGIWSKRQFQIYSEDRLWTGRWDYYDNPQCSTFLYAIIAAGSYVQRAGRYRRHEEIDRATLLGSLLSSRPSFKRNVTNSSVIRTLRSVDSHRSDDFSNRWLVAINKKVQRRKRSLTDSVHRLLRNEQPIVQSRFATMLRDHQMYETDTRKSLLSWTTLSGTTELDLHIAESILISGNTTISARCSDQRLGVPLTMWPRNCVPRTIEAPSTLGLRAKLGVNWNGQYILLLGSRDDNSWESPLRQCGQISPRNSVLRAHLRTSIGLRFGLLSSGLSSEISVRLLLSQVLCFYLVR